MITTAEYLREKTRAEKAEARVKELEALLEAQHESEIEDWSEGKDLSE